MSREWMAVDVGNSRIKLGRFDPAAELPQRTAPQPVELFDVGTTEPAIERLGELFACHRPPDYAWIVASVNRPAATRLVDWLRRQGVAEPVLLCADDLPLAVDVPRPDMVGIDRLLACLTVDRLRTPDRPAIVVDLGSAITVDLLSATGAFLGGAILPGIAMAARGMYEFTDLLPLLDMHQLEAPPDPLGRSTEEAMRAGLFWGAIGGVRELIDRYETRCEAPADVFMTGGAAPSVAGLLKAEARYEPHLVLSGIALAGRHLQQQGLLGTSGER